MKKVSFFVASIVCLIFCGCMSEKVFTDEKVENVTRIFMHERGHYTFFSENPDSPEIIINTVGTFPEKIFKDVPKDKPMWYRYRMYRRNGEMHYEFEIHIRSVKDIEGAGWDHGKFGKGQTTVIE